MRPLFCYPLNFISISFFYVLLFNDSGPIWETLIYDHFFFVIFVSLPDGHRQDSSDSNVSADSE